MPSRSSALRRRRQPRAHQIERLEPRSLLAGLPLANDADTLLLLPFDGTLAGASGETPSETPVDGNGSSGQVNLGYHVGQAGTLRYENAGNIDPTAGTVEFWIRPDWSADGT